MNVEQKVLVVFLFIGFVSLGYLAIMMLTPESEPAAEDVVVFPETLEFQVARQDLVADGEVGETDAILATQDGETVVVPRLLRSGGLTATPNDGLYEYRADATDFSSRYTIAYHEFDGSIIISLQSEPLAAVRREAEQQLLQLTNLPQVTLCDLMISVTTPMAVSHQYSGQNLGLSFCPNSVSLP